MDRSVIRDGFLFAVCILGEVVSITFLVFWAMINFVAEPRCATTERMTDRDTRYEFPGGCYIQMDDGSYIHEDNYIFEENND